MKALPLSFLTLAVAAATATPVQAAVDACGKTITTARETQRLADIHEIKNVASLHEYYHTALQHGEELKYIWAQKTPGVSWTNNTDRYVGMESMVRFYVTGLPKKTSGALWYHMLTTPVIEVAADGKTAKGIWMSFGNVSGSMVEGQKDEAQWTQEKYGIDFVKENGRWKIWHLRTYVDFYTPVGKDWLDPANNLAAPHVQDATGAGVKAEPGVSFEMAKPDERGSYYEGYHVKRIPTLAPQLPQPYCSFKDTHSY